MRKAKSSVRTLSAKIWLGSSDSFRFTCERERKGKRGRWGRGEEVREEGKKGEDLGRGIGGEEV